MVGNAHLVAGGATSVATLLTLLQHEGITTERNPDVYIKEYAHFGVDDARELRERADLAAQGDRRVFIIVAPVMTTEAQNALLKTLEEPPGNALFFIVVPSPETLLPTLRSRVQKLALDAQRDVGAIDSSQFLAANPQKRIDMLKPLLEKGEDDRRDITNIIIFLSTLERMLGAMPRDENLIPGLDAIYRARKYTGDKGSLLKPLLEQVALLAPVVK